MYESRMARHLESMQHHELSAIARDAKGNPTGYLARNPDRSAHHFFVHEGFGPRIVLYGDHHVGALRGVVSTSGCGFDWFAGPLEADYLAEEFLRPRWTSERASVDLRDPGGWEGRGIPNTSERARLLDALQTGGSGDLDAYANLRELWSSNWDAERFPGHGYDLDELASLCAMQQTFARLRARGTGIYYLPDFCEPEALTLVAVHDGGTCRCNILLDPDTTPFAGSSLGLLRSVCDDLRDLSPELANACPTRLVRAFGEHFVVRPL